MLKYTYRELKFPIECRGRDRNGREVLKKPVRVEVVVSQNPGDRKNIHMSVQGCPHLTGGHGQRCKASHPKRDKAEEDVFCSYSADIPYALEVST